MTDQTASVAETMSVEESRTARRIIGFDIARAFAIFGMITVNYRSTFSITGDSPEWLETASGLVNGRAAALFVLLAGIGISLLSKAGRLSGVRTDIRGDRHNLLRRAAFLLAIGLLFRQIWEYDILHFYGIYLMIAAVLLTVSNRNLFTVGFLAAMVFPVLYYVLPAQYGIPFWATTSEFTFREVMIDLFFQGYHPVTPWIAFMLAGMMLGRLDLSDPAIRRKMLIGGVALALVSEAIAYVALDMGIFKLMENVSQTIDLEPASVALGTDPYPPMPLFVGVGIGWGMAIVSLCLSFGDRFAERRWITPLVHTGQLALTIYILHGTVGVWAVGWAGYKPHQTLVWILTYSAIFYVVMIIASTLWRRRFERGPVEAIMRRLTDSWKSEINPEPKV
jgi:uncharacterized protein